MKFLFGVLTLSFLIAVPVEAFTQDGRKDGALLWEISGAGLTSPSFLFGTIHMICTEDFQLGPEASQRLSASGKLYLEIDMDDPALAVKTLQLSLMKNQSLKDLISAEEYRRLEAFMRDSVGMPLSLFHRMKPFTLMSLLYTKILPCKDMTSYEQHFMGLAQREGKEILGLERLEDQFAVFDSIPDSTEARMILEMIDSFPRQRAEFQVMVNAYKKRDLPALQKMIQSAPDMAGFEHLLLENRNRRWIPVMQKAMQQGSVYFAVGAGHLPGSTGLIELLRQEGYQVRPIE